MEIIHGIFATYLHNTYIFEHSKFIAPFDMNTHELNVRRLTSEIIAHEDKKKPLSDEALSKALKEKGFPIARRTVAKYREQFNIPVARLRK